MALSVRRLFPIAALIALSLVVSCGGGSNPPQPVFRSPASAPRPAAMPGKIQHVVILIMENRSFDYMFNGFPGADTVQSGVIHTGQTVQLQQIPLEAPGDLAHKHSAFVTDYDNGKMDAFDLEGWDPRLPALAPYAFAPKAEVEPDWSIAQQYTLADRTFESVSSNSYPAHQYLIAGQSAFAIGLPSDRDVWGCDSKAGTTVPVLNSNGKVVTGPFPCFNYLTLADLLDQHRVSWRQYTYTPTYTWNGFDAISQIRFSSDWTTDIIFPTSQFITDVGNGRLAAVTWIVPTNHNSDHSGSNSKSGPAFVASIVNAVGQSKFWRHTVVFVTWDDWGGWYDHVPPPQLDRMGLGFRVPLLVASPWSRHGYVSHVQHEFGSILHFAESTFGVGNLGQTDVRADDLSDCFDFTQSPPPFVHINQVMPDSVLRQIEASDHSQPDQ